MEAQNNPQKRTAKRQLSPLRQFKETYLPLIILATAALLMVVFVLGAMLRGIQGIIYRKELSTQASIAAQEEQERLTAEANALMDEAAGYALHFDYDRAAFTLESFSGDMNDFPELLEVYDQYLIQKEHLVLWDDPNGVVNLSFQQLIADPARAFTNPSYGTSYNRNFVTVDEFRNILLQLYENGYILVSMDDVTSESGLNELYLPEGKTPFILTETSVNYYNYMVDGNGDKVADQYGAGFANKLTEDANGNITCELITSDNQTLLGAYDIVPILESFIETHPDFSYKGARAVLAITGYDGILGYRTNDEARARLGEDAYMAEIDKAQYFVQRLDEMGYEFACYTYGNEAYGNFTTAQIENDLAKWSNEVATISPILANTDIFVFALNSDIAAADAPYTGDSFDTLKSYGYRRFVGFSSGTSSWFYTGDGYIRQGRLLVTGSNLAYHAPWFDGMFDAASILDPSRGEIPG